MKNYFLNFETDMKHLKSYSILFCGLYYVSVIYAHLDYSLIKNDSHASHGVHVVFCI